MPRPDFPAALLPVIGNDAAEMAHLFDLEFSTGTLSLTDASADIAVGATTYVRTGGQLSFQTVEESEIGNSQGIEVVLSGCDLAIIGLLLSATYINRFATVQRVRIDPMTSLVIAEPVTIFKGRMNGGFRVSEERSDDNASPGTAKIVGRFQDTISDLEISRGIQSNSGSLQSFFEGDKLFDLLPQLIDVDIRWGRFED